MLKEPFSGVHVMTDKPSLRSVVQASPQPGRKTTRIARGIAGNGRDLKGAPENEPYITQVKRIRYDR